jgi:hypothetical protein
MSVYINPEEPRVTALIVDVNDNQIAVRTWELFEDGIGVTCECEKENCEADALLMRPELPHNIENQLLEELEKFRQEYRVHPSQVGYGTKRDGVHELLPRFRLEGRWKDENVIGATRARFLATVLRDHPEQAIPLKPEDLPSREEIGQRMAEAERFLDLAAGLLFFEGALRIDDLVKQVLAVESFRPWLEEEDWLPLVKRDDRFRVRGNIVYRPEVRNLDWVLREKRLRPLPPLKFTATRLLQVAEGSLPLTREEQRIDNLLRQGRSRWASVRELQHEFRNLESPMAIIQDLLNVLEARDIDDLNRQMQPIMDLWNHTPRWELRGRTPMEVASFGR